MAERPRVKRPFGTRKKADRRTGTAAQAMKMAATLSSISLSGCGPCVEPALNSVRDWAVATHTEIASHRVGATHINVVKDGVGLHGRYDAPGWRFNSSAQPNKTFDTFEGLVASETRRYATQQQERSIAPRHCTRARPLVSEAPPKRVPRLPPARSY
jgi:hypothetical protein